MTPTVGIDFIPGVSGVKANMLVSAYPKVDPSDLISGEGLRHSEEKCGDVVHRMARD